MRYAAVLSELNKLGNLKAKWDLRNIKRLLSLLGNPEDGLRIVNITGTNGKGSVAAMLTSILREAGYSVGTYTSPHMDDFRERIAVNGSMIPQAWLARIYSQIRPFFRLFKDGGLSLFEITTAIALKYFSGRNVDFAVLEAGMGGRLDATNVGPQELLIITNVDLDHTQMLGNSIAKIAREKAGLLRGKLLLTGEGKEDALIGLGKACKRRNARLVQEQGELKPGLRLRGDHQFRNAALAARAAKILVPKISDAVIRKGLEKAFMPGRLEIISHNPLVIMDGAHNPAAAKELAGALGLFPHKRLILVYGTMKDKDADGVLRHLAPKADVLVLNQPKLERAMPVGRLVRIAKRHAKDIKVVGDVRKSVEYAQKMAGRGGLVLVTGSLYMLSEARGKNRLRIAQ